MTNEERAFRVKTALTKIEDIILETVKDGDSSGCVATGILNVLSALRGPDCETSKAKEAGTNHVRCAAFPRLSQDEGFITPWVTSTSQPPTTGISLSQHFNTHVRLALEALNISFRNREEK